MARIARLENIAASMLKDSCIRNAEFARVSAAGILDYVRVKRGRVMNKSREDLNAAGTVDYTAPTVAKEQQNGMEFRGYITVDGLPVEFYGSEAAFTKLKGMG